MAIIVFILKPYAAIFPSCILITISELNTIQNLYRSHLKFLHCEYLLHHGLRLRWGAEYKNFLVQKLFLAMSQHVVEKLEYLFATPIFML